MFVDRICEKHDNRTLNILQNVFGKTFPKYFNFINIIIGKVLFKFNVFQYQFEN